MVVLDLLDSLEAVIAKIQKIDNKLRALNSCISRNLVSNTNNSQALSWLKPTQSAPSSLDVFSYSSSATPATSPALPEGDPMDLGIGKACGLLTPSEYLCQINNNFCIYCRGANHYAGDCPKTNQKTMLRKMVIQEK